MRRKLLPLMPGAVIGNGRMLATIKGNGELYRLFWPHIDQVQHLGQLIAGIRETGPSPGMVQWLHDAAWNGEQRYLDENALVFTTRRRDDLALAVEQADFILPEDDVLVRHYQVQNLAGHARNMQMVVYCTFLIDESALYDTMYIHFPQQALIQFRRNIFLALNAPGYPLAGYHTGRRDTPGDPLAAASRGEFFGNSSTLRAGAGAVAWNLGEIAPGESRQFTLYLAAASGERDVLQILSRMAGETANHWQKITVEFWEQWLGRPSVTAGIQNENPDNRSEKGEHRAEVPAGNDGEEPDHIPRPQANIEIVPSDKDDEERACRRSLMVLKLLSNRDTGGNIAAPEFDPFYMACGGYGYCWPRDGMYTALALDQAGYHQEARDFYLFAARVQNADGSWQQRYFTNGSWAPTWGQQIDQVGAVLWGYHHHFALTGDRDFLAEIWPSADLGAGYLVDHLSEKNGLPQPGLDLWEDNFAQSTYAAAAVYGGLVGASLLAEIKGEAEKADRWRRAASGIKESIIAHLWNPDRQCFYRAINRQVGCYDYQCALDRGDYAWTGKEPSGLYETFWVEKDTRIDAAVLGLVFPFTVLKPDDPRMNAAIGTLEQVLGNKQVGGLHRYEGDNYAGGNPWVLTTLWLGIVRALRGEREAARALYRWALDNASPTGLLPEQVNKERGGPAWVLPLGWSHAMYILLHLTLEGNLTGLPI
ncbi:hypothetical protein GFC01_03040 [Desulfofundulus thermobenzoicus]|uniref:GH15-like domain-containing protein n=1 Tax=Desulfofundulus thermobenzoicus TaxID=29376 RepID=A0A6N7IMP8_9FIRM|nr:glycoside hydrolase family 15 protein [Desulfofundulus thermobenzoicus]MQL51252.1 hypothetical protein [Desulfofundulus thermobenzoicus]